MRYSCLASGCLAAMLFIAPAAGADALDPAIREQDLDLAACGSFTDGRANPPAHEMMLNALGLKDTTAHYYQWSGGAIDYSDLKGHVFKYRLALAKPTPIGSVIYTTREIAFLKEGTPYPGDPDNPAHWTPAQPAPYCPAQRLLTLPVGFATRAILFTDEIKSGRSGLGPLRLIRSRLANLAPLACAVANREYAAPEGFGGRLHAASNLVRGRGPWTSAGKNADGNIPTPYVSDVDPCWIVLAWDEPQTFQALYLQDNFTAIRFETYRGPAHLSPLLATDEEWKRVEPKNYTSRVKNGRWVRFAAPITTRGLRIYTDKVLDPQGNRAQAAEVSSLLVLGELGDGPLPAVPALAEQSPFVIPYAIEKTGLCTLAVDDAAGTRVRNLVARELVETGRHEAHWDLRDERGEYVAPGEYRWKAITHPELRLRYEFTPYPNVSQFHPENTPWLNGPTGSGGWLADHSPPYGVCARGDFVFVGAPCPEAGVGFAACDISGRKLWGIHSFGPFGGARRMATDGKTVYVENMGIAYNDVAVEHVWGVDIATHKFQDVINRKDSESRKTGISGIAADDGRLYVAVHAPERWLAGAAGEEDVDIVNCLPLYPEKRKPKRGDEIVPDPRTDFVRLLRLKGTPPGYAPAHGLTWLDSTLGPGRRQHVLVSFKKPVPLGSCVLPVPQHASYKVKLSFLKPAAPFPPDPDDSSQWTAFETQAALAWDVATPPAGASTRALLISFSSGDDDDLSDRPRSPGKSEKGPLDDLGLGDADRSGLGDKTGAWKGQIEGLKILRRRFKNLYATAKISVSSGTVDKEGVWIARRTEPLSREKPECFVMEWDAPQKLRGLALKEIDCKLVEVDVWTGPDSAPVDMKDDAHWTQVGSCVPRRRTNHSGFGSHNANARYMDDTVDFGREARTRAVRLRVVEQWLVNTREGSCAKDLLDIDPARCRLFGVAALEYLGGEAPVDPLVAERLEVYDTAGPQPRLVKEVCLREAGNLACGPDKSLYAISSGAVVRVALDGGAHATVISDLKEPLSLALDAAGNFYVFDDAADRKVIRVYDPSGRYRRDIGTPGGYRPGPWDPHRFQNLTALAVDRENKLWAADSTYWPKRISVWKTDGTFLREYLGPTCYGGAGQIDPWDKTRMTYGPLEFELDWTKGVSRLKSLTWNPADGWNAGERPIHLGGRIYMVTDCGEASNSFPVGIVYVYENQRLRQAAAMGRADAWPPLQSPEIRGRIGNRALSTLQFLWIDRNEDGEVQFDELTLEDRTMGPLTRFNEDLGIQAGPWRFEVKEFLKSGVPVYEKKLLPLKDLFASTGEFYRLGNGNFYVMGGNKGEPEACYAPDGRLLWTYPNFGRGVGPNRSAGPYRPDQVLCQFGIAGHLTAKGGDLGEFFVVHQNLGQWNIWTADGLLAGWLFRENRDPKAEFWQMPENRRGMALDNISQLEEHFHAFVCRTPDDHYYAVAGKPHASIVEILGLDEFKRLGGTRQVSAADLDRVKTWDRQTVRQEAKERIRIVDCCRAGGKVDDDDASGEWKRAAETTIAPGITFRVLHDGENLYLRYEVNGAGPFKNTGNRWDLCFRSGACLDFLIGTDEAADPARRAPVAGDKRLLATIVDGKPLAVLYDMVVPGTPAEKKWRVASPVGQTEADVVRTLDRVRLVAKSVWSDPNTHANYRGYVAEIRVPLKELGVTLRDGLRLKMDCGVLQADRDGGMTVRRVYWANKLPQTVSDIPSEARLMPDTWGWIRFSSGTKGPSLETPGGTPQTEDRDLKELLHGLEPK